jgi:hypothetical protein
MKNVIISGLLIAATLSLVACGSTTAIVSSAVITGAKIVKGVVGTASERDVLCKYYSEHRTEIETVRAYYKANWQSVPEKDKPALIKINEQLNACDANTSTASPAIAKTTAQALLDAFKHAVGIYRELKAAGVL